MVTDFPIQRILDRLVERIVDVLPIEAAGVTLISPGVHPRYVAASNDSALRYERLQSTIGEGPCVLAFESGKPVAVPDLRVEDRFPEFSSQALDAGLGAVFTFPLNHGDRPLGALDLYRDSAGPLSADALIDAQTLADVASAYIQNAQAREDLVESSAASRAAALHDGLTGLPNRALFMDRIEHAFSRSRRSGTLSAVFFLDLDRFKSINDLFGHRVGDELLVAVAARLTSHLRPGDTLARLSGDEFVILCEGLESRSQATALGTRLQTGIDEPFEVSGHRLLVASSIGVAIAEPGDHDADQILHHADMAMYEAKRQGGGRSRIYDPDDRTPLGLEKDLHDAVKRGELRTVFQPIVTTATGRITGFEALLRWDHPTRGVVAPAIAVPMAERAGLIVDIGRWVLTEAWTAWDRWHRMPGGAELTMAVNVSPHQLTSPGFVDTLHDVVGERTTDMYSLTLDVNESVLVTDSSRALMVMNDLKEMGVSLALDDFGAGYASLNYLRRFPLDILKVDRGFISALGADETSESIVSAVAQLAHALGMNVIAEGVETAEQRRFAGRLGCDSSQGYYFAEPMAAADVTELIARHGAAGPFLAGRDSQQVPTQRSPRQPRSMH
jgi:diguanylate cyclase (GGDEF)-like protein